MSWEEFLKWVEEYAQKQRTIRDVARNKMLKRLESQQVEHNDYRRRILDIAGGA